MSLGARRGVGGVYCVEETVECDAGQGISKQTERSESVSLTCGVGVISKTPTRRLTRGGRARGTAVVLPVLVVYAGIAPRFARGSRGRDEREKIGVL